MSLKTVYSALSAKIDGPSYTYYNRFDDVTLSSTCWDPNGQTFVYDWHCTKEDLTKCTEAIQDPTLTDILIKAESLEEGTYSITLEIKVVGNETRSASDEVTIVMESQSRPEVYIIELESDRIPMQPDLKLNGHARDFLGEKLTNLEWSMAPGDIREVRLSPIN